MWAKVNPTNCLSPPLSGYFFLSNRKQGRGHGGIGIVLVYTCPRKPEDSIGSLGAEVLVIVSCQAWILGTELHSTGRANTTLLLASNGKRPCVFLGSSQCTEQPHPANDYSLIDVWKYQGQNGKPGFRSKVYIFLVYRNLLVAKSVFS